MIKDNVKVLLKPGDFEPSFKKWNIVGVLNPGGVRMPNGKIVLYVRVAETAEHTHGNMKVCPVMTSKEEYHARYQEIHTGDILKQGSDKILYLKDGTCRLPNISHFRRVILDSDGYNIEKIEQSPSFSGIPGESDYGVEDPRITKIGSKYYMTYVGVSVKQGVSTYLASSKNLKDWKRHGIIFREQNKDCMLFPEKINGEYVAFNRPESGFHFSKPGIWISYSKDLVYWGRDKSLMKPRENSWESNRIGGGAPPIKTDNGWLAIYHGMKEEKNGRVYNGGAVLLDLKNPEKILARSKTKEPLIKPNDMYEKKGYIDDVVFPTVTIPDLNNKDLLIYSGGADSVVTVRKLSFKDIFKSMEKIR